jgi:hypothetical protein
MSILNGLVYCRVNIELKISLLLFMVTLKEKTFLLSHFSDFNWFLVQL